MKRLMIIAVAAMILSACGSKNDKTEARHSEAVEHEHHGHAHHSHEMMIAGVAQPTDTVAGHITIVKLHDGETQTFDYTTSNPDKIAAWQAGDTVTVFLHHHHHGEEAHDSVTAIKIGKFECKHHDHDACPDGHDHDGHGHNHEHHHVH